jgi:hypothetical protein
MCTSALRLRRNAASSSSVGFRSLACGSRHEAPLPITRILAAIASPPATGATLNSRSCRRPPAPHWLGEPDRSLRVLTLSVARWCSPRSSVPRSARSTAPKGQRSECHRARVVRTRSLFRTTRLPTQSAFSWLDLALRRGEPRSLCRSIERFAPRTPPSPPLGDPPRQGDGSPPTAISSLPPALPPLVRSNQMPLTNLCSRLLLSRAPVGVPTPKPATHVAWPVGRCPVPMPTPEREQRNRTVLDDAGTPFLVSPTLGGGVVDATPTRRSHLRRPCGDPQRPGSRPAAALSAVREPGQMAPYAPCRNPCGSRQADRRTDRQNPFPLPYVIGQLSRARGVFRR